MDPHWNSSLSAHFHAPSCEGGPCHDMAERPTSWHGTDPLLLHRHCMDIEFVDFRAMCNSMGSIGLLPIFVRTTDVHPLEYAWIINAKPTWSARFAFFSSFSALGYLGLTFCRTVPHAFILVHRAANDRLLRCLQLFGLRSFSCVGYASGCVV